MSDIKINDDGTFNLTDTGDLELVTDRDESTVQYLKQRLRTFKGEAFLNRFLGIPYIESILIKNPNSNLVRSIVIDYILETPRVISVDRIKVTLDNQTRKMSINFQARLASGNVVTVQE